MAGNTDRSPDVEGRYNLSNWITQTIVSNQHVSSARQEAIRQMIYDNLEQAEKRYRTFIEEQLAADRTDEEMKRCNSHMEDFLTQCFRQRHLELFESKDTSLHDDAHVHALRMHSDILQQDLRLEGTVLLDRLIEKDVLSEAGRQSILSRKTNQQRNAAFIRYVSQSFNAETFKTVFLPELKVEHNFLAAELAKEVAHPPFSMASLKQCLSCKAKEQINIRRFASRLYQMGGITESVHLDLISIDIPHRDKWNHLIHATRKIPSVLMKALQSYNHRLYNKLQRKRHLHLECTCDVTSTIGQCSNSTHTESGEGDVARMSDLSSESDSPSQIHQLMYTYKRHLDVRKADQNDGIVISGSGTSSSNGFEHEPDGPNHGIHPHQVMKAPLPPVSKDNPFTKQRRASDGASQKRWKEQTQPTKTRGNNEFLCHTITSDVLDMEGSLIAQCKEVKKLKYKLMKLKKQAVHNAGVRKQYRHYINYSRNKTKN